MADRILADPVLRAFEADAVARQLPALLIEVERVADTVLQGTHGRRRVGLGESFWQFRRYEPGDSAARIDWRQSAKRDRLFVRETEWEAAHSLYLWRDSSASMDYASHANLPTKARRAEMLVLALASLALRGGERVGWLGGARPAIAHATNLARLAEQQLELPKSQDMPPRAAVGRHGIVVLCGDLLGPPQALAGMVQGYAGQGAQGILLQILDPAEKALPFAGRVRFDGMEGEASELVPRAEALRESYRDRLAGHQAALARIAAEAGWRLHLDVTDRPVIETLTRLYGMLGGRA